LKDKVWVDQKNLKFYLRESRSTARQSAENMGEKLRRKGLVLGRFNGWVGKGISSRSLREPAGPREGQAKTEKIPNKGEGPTIRKSQGGSKTTIKKKVGKRGGRSRVAPGKNQGEG